MTKSQLFCDVNLAEIAFARDGLELTLTFLSMDNGSEVGRLRCSGLLAVKYHTVLSALPLYVGEVNHDEFDSSQATEALKRLDYSFVNGSGSVLIPRLDRLHYVHIEGGEVYMEIICKGLDSAYPFTG